LRKIKVHGSESRHFFQQFRSGRTFVPQAKPSPASSAFASIMVVMEFETAAERRTRLAAELADRFSSRLIGTAAEEILSPLYFETPTAGASSIVEIEERQTAERLAKAESIFRRAAGARDRVEWRQAVRHPLGHVLEQARAADLIVAGRPQRGHRPGPMSLDGGSLVMDAGRPVLFVPPQIDRLSAKRILIGWKDSREARRAVSDSLPLLKTAEDVFIVAIDGEEQGAKDVGAHLSGHDVSSTVYRRPLPADAIADELLRVAQQEGADLLVCGAYAHSRAREWVLGGVTRDLLDHSPLCCLMSH
jgi:nucleotide-binding universal stress UspA family protein